MKFNKQMSNNTLSIPSGVFKISGFEADEKAEIHALDSAVVILKKRMTATELIQAMDALHQLATELTVHLAMVCGTCDDCEDGCPFDGLFLVIRIGAELGSGRDARLPPQVVRQLQHSILQIVEGTDRHHRRGRV